MFSSFHVKLNDLSIGIALKFIESRWIKTLPGCFNHATDTGMADDKCISFEHCSIIKRCLHSCLERLRIFGVWCTDTLSRSYAVHSLAAQIPHIIFSPAEIYLDIVRIVSNGTRYNLCGFVSTLDRRSDNTV